MKVLSIGEILWDIFPEQELLGGAALNFSANLNRLGEQAALITAVGHDSRGSRAMADMTALSLRTDFTQIVRNAPTGTAAVEMDIGGEPHFAIQRPAAFDYIQITPEILTKIRGFLPDWIYFGTLLQIQPATEAVVKRIAMATPARCFYDINLRTGQWSLPLVQRLSKLATVVKLNENEIALLSGAAIQQTTKPSIEEFCKLWARAYDIETICVTQGASGCSVYQNGELHSYPGYPAAVRDTVGSGDAFAAAFLHGYHRDWPPARTARFANALGSLVASRPGANPPWTIEEIRDLATTPVS